MHYCPLCHHAGEIILKNITSQYFECTCCKGIFIPSNKLPDAKSEKERYLAHNNDVNDKYYQQFVNPIVQKVLKDFTPAATGLDYGAGTGPVIAKLLEDNNYTLTLYDPFFHNYAEVLKKKYDFIVCCEVIEHFHNPEKEFVRLKSLLNPGGKLYCMTHIYQPKNTAFKSWYYKNDPTHVFMYQEETLKYIKRNIAFTGMTIEGRLIIFEN